MNRQGCIDLCFLGDVYLRGVVRAFELLLARGRSGEVYNAASGRDVSIREIIDELMRLMEVEAPIEAGAERVRADDAPCVRADVSKIAGETGWRAEIPLQRSLSDRAGG